jgi:hypothetical protein
MCVLTAMVVAVMGIQQGRDLSQLAMLCGTFLTTAFAGKVSQKMVEAKNSTEVDQK